MTLAADLYNALQGQSWDDLRAPASVIPIRGQSGDPDVDTDGSLLFDAATGEQIAVIWQMPHAWNSTPIRPHVHWSKTTSGGLGVSLSACEQWIGADCYRLELLDCCHRAQHGRHGERCQKRHYRGRFS